MDKSRLQAAASGSTHYKGKPCKSCGQSLRYTTTGVCVECTKRYNDNYRERIKTQLKEARGGA